MLSNSPSLGSRDTCDGRHKYTTRISLDHNNNEALAYFITTIANSVMARVAAWLKKSPGKRIQGHIFNSRSESMLGVMAMLESDMAWNAEVKIITGSACDKIVFREFYNK